MADQTTLSQSPKLDSGAIKPESDSAAGSRVEAKTGDALARPQSSPRNSQHKRPADRDASRDDAAAASCSSPRSDHKRQKSPAASVSDGHPPSPPAVASPAPTTRAATGGSPPSLAESSHPSLGQPRQQPRHSATTASASTPGTREPVSRSGPPRASRNSRPRGSASASEPTPFPPSTLNTAGQQTATSTPRVMFTQQSTARGHHSSATPSTSASASAPAGRARRDAPPPRYPGIETQPETRPISLTQLVNEVKGIYVGLVMVESKCIEIDNDQGASGDSLNKLNDEQWQALIALHRTLLHEHHDFMLASQHPSASPALRRLAQKYAMPARMWRHGIHSFLELLRHRLPASREHMITFIYLAYSMMALLYETVPAFEDTWVECLGDLSRYRMAIEDDNQRVRDTWTGVSRHWYTVASDRAPTTGRLYHHLAILARPNVIAQMHFYAKSLCVPIPFTSTRESILTLFDPILNGVPPRGVPQIDTDFAMAHAILFTNSPCLDRLDSSTSKYLQALPMHITRVAKDWIETGAQIAVVNCCAMLQYGDRHNALMKLLQKSISAADTENSNSDDDESNIDDSDDLKLGSSDDNDTDVAMTDAPGDRQPPAGSDALARSQKLAVDTDKVVLSLNGNPSCNGYTHVRLVWMLSMARLPGAMALLEDAFPWGRLANALNLMMASCSSYEHIERESFPQLGKAEGSSGPKEEPKAKSEDRCRDATTSTQAIPPPPRSDAKPLPEDWALRGLSWAENIFPRTWFDNVDTMDDDDRFMETGSMAELRRERILWLAWKLARYEKWLVYDSVTHAFSVARNFINEHEISGDGDAIMDDMVKVEKKEADDSVVV